MEKIQRRVKDYEIKVLNEPRPDKKLLVLDIDYTLFGKNLTVISSKIFIPRLIESLYLVLPLHLIVLALYTQLF